MAHELSIRKNGMAEMAYVGKKPWHGLGQELKLGASIEEWAVAAGMDWKILRSKVRYAVTRDADAKASYETFDDSHVLFRSDTKAPLSVVSDGFKIVQPRDTLEFFRDLAEGSGFHINTAGVLRGGRKFWAQAEAGQELADAIIGNDIVRGKILIATSCDGSMNTIVKSVNEAVVCANTLSMALGERGKEIRVSHRSHFKASDVKLEFGLVAAKFRDFIADARDLARFKVSPAQVDEFILKVVADVDFGKEKTAALLESATKARQSAGYQKVLSLFGGAGRGATAPGRKGTAWGLVNAVTEYVDHHRRSHSVDTRIDSAWFGGGDDMKSEALEEALVYVR